MPSCGVCLCVTFVHCVKTNKDIFELFSSSGSHTILVFYAKRDGDIPTLTSLTGASDAGGVGINHDSEPICLLLTLQQARCCKHGRRWTTATILQWDRNLWEWEGMEKLRAIPQHLYFRQISRFISEMMQDMTIVTLKVE